MDKLYRPFFKLPKTSFGISVLQFLITDIYTINWCISNKALYSRSICQSGSNEGISVANPLHTCTMKCLSAAKLVGIHTKCFVFVKTIHTYLTINKWVVLKLVPHTYTQVKFISSAPSSRLLLHINVNSFLRKHNTLFSSATLLQLFHLQISHTLKRIWGASLKVGNLQHWTFAASVLYISTQR